MTDTSQIAQIAQIAPIPADHLAESFCALGATDEQLAELFGVPEATLHGWMANIAAFADAVRRGRNVADAGVANSLYQLAVGYSHRVDRVLMGRDGPLTVSYTKHHPPRSRACMDWLVNRRPDLWGRAAIKRKLQEADDAADAAARRPPFLPPQALAALVLEAHALPDREPLARIMSELEARGPTEHDVPLLAESPSFASLRPGVWHANRTALWGVSTTVPPPRLAA